jgi:aryl-alcohol dehydrogenase-like predicted oxidoreductase
MVDTLSEAARAGKVAWSGCSNWTADRIRAAQAYADRAGKPRFVIDQMRWSLASVNRSEQRIPGLVEMDEPLHAYHRESGLAAAAYSSQAQGFFGGDYGRGIEQPEASHGEKVKRYYYSDENFRRLDRVRDLAREFGRPPTHVALAYVLSQPFPTYALIGTSRLDHLKESCAGADLELSPDQVAHLRGKNPDPS